jgi:amidase
LGPGVVLLLPAASSVAFPLDASDGEIDLIRGATLALTAPASLLGLPSLSLPLARVDGLPVNLAVVGPRGSDEALLDLAAALVP